jgi:hypothetical protein
MTIAKPYHRNYRAMKPDGPNASYSSEAYISDDDYARSAAHYVRAFLIIQKDLEDIFEYVEPSSESLETYSYRIHGLLMRACIEVEANLKAILTENTYSKHAGKLTMVDYKKVDVTHHLSSYEVSLPIWNGPQRILKPFGTWPNGPLDWYQAYNASKHDRQDAFKKANVRHLIDAVAGLLVVLSSQFCTRDFSAGETLWVSVGGSAHSLKPAIGSLFRITFPTNWTDEEMYGFDWTSLAGRLDRFAKIDYDQI